MASRMNTAMRLGPATTSIRARTFPAHVVGGKEEAARNAYLFVVAPDLLDALRKARHYVGMVRSSDIADDDPIFGVIDEIDCALSKALPPLDNGGGLGAIRTSSPGRR
jgi:hypothetical protein